MKTKSNFYCLQLLINFCNVFVIVPPYKLSSVSMEDNFITYKRYSGVVLLVIISSYFWSTYQKLIYLYNEYNSVVFIVDNAANFLLTATNMYSIITLIFSKNDKLKNMFIKIIKLDEKIISLHDNTKTTFCKRMLCFQIGILTTLALDFGIWMTSLGWKWYKYYLVMGIQFYRFCTVLFLVIQISDLIQDCFKSLNLILCQIVRDIKEEKWKNHRANDLKNVGIWYHNLCDIVDDFNDLFGLNLLLSVLFVIAMSVSYIDMPILYSMYRSTLDGQRFGTGLILLCVVWLTMIMVKFIGTYLDN